MPFDTFAARIVYIVVFGLGATSTAQTDVWWLLRAGRDIWRSGHVPLVEHYSHTATGRYWSNHEWLWEATAFALHQVGGMPLLSAWTGVTLTATVWLMRRASAASGYVVPVVLVLALPLMSISWTTRPQVTSMLLFALTMTLLAREHYLWIPPLFLLWANLHAQVVMGGALLAIVVAAAAVEAASARTSAARRRAQRLTMTLAASAAATLLTPLGTRLWAYVLGADARPGQAHIEEWTTAFRPGIVPSLFWPMLVLAAVLSVRRRDRLVDWSGRVPLLATVAMAPLAMLALRNVPFFVIAVAPLLMTLLEFHTREPIGRVGRAQGVLVGAGLAMAVGVSAVWLAAPEKLAWRPVSPSLTTALRSCPGPLYNGYDEGAALIWWVPDVKVFVDNRQDPYPADVINASAGLTAPTYPAVFERYRIRCAYVARTDPLARALQRDAWRTTYDDGTSVVLVPPLSLPRATSATE